MGAGLTRKLCCARPTNQVPSARPRPCRSLHEPETGQCAVTALIVQDHSGGDLLRAIVNGESHYWNRLPDGTEADLTRRQFDRYPDIGEVIVRDREYVLSNPDTAERYAALRQNMERLG